MKLSCDEHEEYTSLRTFFWLDYGTGMMAMYKTDWENVGGKIRMYTLPEGTWEFYQYLSDMFLDMWKSILNKKFIQKATNFHEF